VVVPGTARTATQALADGQVVADVDSRVKAYATHRNELEKGAAKLDETAKPGDLVTAELTLAAKIRESRATAKRGDIFIPAVHARFRQLLNSEMKGVRGQNTRGIIRDEGPGPGAFSFKVNDTYPKEPPLGTVPANIPEVLPPLPEHLEYRFVDKHLILLDTRANLIVDYMPNAIP